MKYLSFFFIFCMMFSVVHAEDMVGIESLDDDERVDVIIRFLDEADVSSAAQDIFEARLELIKVNNFARSSLNDLNEFNSSSDLQANFSSGIHEINGLGMISGSFTRSELEDLMQNYEVDYIEPETEYTINLDTSVDIIQTRNFTNISFLGTKFKGADSAVCVIDTGIDYTHVDLFDSYLDGYDFVNLDGDPLDDHGHGTHVSGIIASRNTTYEGVAPEIGIVSLKALNSTGGGNTTTIVSSINWCITNAALHNITVISMSIGNSLFHSSTACDASFPSMTTAISNAVDANISVIISSGNELNKAGISSPSCIADAISVGATDDSDVAAYFSNSADNLDLLAPGYPVISNALSSGYVSAQGTSMAAPHVSGAFALLQAHYRFFKGVYATPSQLLGYFNNSGVNVTDTNAVTKPRIDVYGAYLEMIDDFPSLEFTNVTPDDNSSLNVSTFTIEVNVTDASDSINGCRLFLNESEIDMNLSGDLCSVNLTRPGGSYEYYVTAVDSEGAFVNTDFRTFNISNQAPVIDVNFTLSASTLTNLSCNYSVVDLESDPFNVTVSWFKDGVVQSSFENLTLVNYTNTSKNENWTCQIYAEDSMMNVNAVNSSVVILNSLPVYSLVNQIVNESDYFNFTFNVSDDDNDTILVSTNVSFLQVIDTSIFYQTTYQDSGVYDVLVNVSDGDDSILSGFNFTINDTEDSDNDGINDSDDVIEGNTSTLNSSDIEMIEINGSDNLSVNYSGVQNVLFKDSNNNTLIDVDWNFSKDLALNFTVEMSDGKVRVSGFDLNGSTKTLYINKTSSSWNRVCIVDEEDVALSSISSSCNGVGEVALSCPGTSGSYTCNETSGYFVVSGLSHTSISAFTYTAPSSGGGGGGGSSRSIITTEQVCTPDWICGTWGSCSDEKQSRECFDGNSCGSLAGAPLFERSCEMPQIDDELANSDDIAENFDAVGSVVGEPEVVEVEMNETVSVTRSIKEKLKGLQLENIFFIVGSVIVLLGALSLISKTSELLRMMRK